MRHVMAVADVAWHTPCISARGERTPAPPKCAGHMSQRALTRACVVQVAILVQTAREDGRTFTAAAGGAAAEGAAGAPDAAAEAGAEPGEEWTSEQLSNAALLISSVLAAHAAGQPAVRLRGSLAVLEKLCEPLQSVLDLL